MGKKKATLIKAFTVENNDKERTKTVVLAYRDENGKKYRKFVPRAIVPYYVIKDKNSPEAINQPAFISIDKVKRVDVYADKLYEALEKETGLHGYVTQCRISGEYYKLNNLHKHPHIYGSDMDITDYYISLFYENYEPVRGLKLKKAYFDIETDTINLDHFPYPEEAEVPINAISYMDGLDKNFKVWLLRNSVKKNPQIAEFEQNMKNFKKYMIDKIYNEDNVKLNNLDIQIFDNELDMIKDFFAHVNKEDPDFLMAWNMSFDIKYLLNRLDRLGVSYQEKINICCNKDYLGFYDGEQNYYQITPSLYFKDYPGQNYEDRWDYFDISSGTNWIDQMLLYANIRKGQGALDSHALDAIAYEELGKNKLEFGVGETMKNIAYKNFKRFVEYNIRDVLLLYLIEEKVMDVDMVHTLSQITNTRIDKVMKKTISIKNFIAKFAKEHGMVMRNNINISYGGDKDFEEKIGIKAEIPDFSHEDPLYEQYLQVFDMKDNYGAYVADPKLNDNVGIEVIEGIKSRNIFENVCDQDLSSLYPSIIISYNLDPETQIGKFFLLDDHIKNKLIYEYGYNNENVEIVEDKGKGKTDVVPYMIDSIISKDWNAIGEKYFDLPSTTDMIEEIKKMVSKKSNSNPD